MSVTGLFKGFKRSQRLPLGRFNRDLGGIFSPEKDSVLLP